MPKDAENTAIKPSFLKHQKLEAKTVLDKQTQELWRREGEISSKGRATYALILTPVQSALFARFPPQSPSLRHNPDPYWND